MLVIDPAQANLVVRVVMFDYQRRVLFTEALERARKLDVVLAIGRLNRNCAVARGVFDFDRGRQLSGA